MADFPLDPDRIARLQSEPNPQFGHAGGHRGNGSPDCPRTLHHHDKFCAMPTLGECIAAGRGGARVRDLLGYSRRIGWSLAHLEYVLAFEGTTVRLQPVCGRPQAREVDIHRVRLHRSPDEALGQHRSPCPYCSDMLERGKLPRVDTLTAVS